MEPKFPIYLSLSSSEEEESGSYQRKKMETQPISMNVNKRKWSDLDQETREKILDGNVSFQGDILKVSELLGNDLDGLDDLDLDAIINQEIIEIGAPIKFSRDYDERIFIHRNFYESEMSRQECIKKVFSTQHFDFEKLKPLKVIYISGPESSGKSTAMHNIALQIKQKNPQDLVVTLDLKKCQKALLNFPFFESTEEAIVQFLIDELVKPKHPKIFRKLFEDQRVVLMLDGFGDKSRLSDMSCDSTRQLTASLAETSVKQIWYTSLYGFYTKRDVSLAVRMRPFDRNDQVEYLVKYWRTTVEGADLKENDLQVIAEEIIQKQESSVENKLRSMIGEIFMCIVLAEVFSPLILSGKVSFPDDFVAGWIFEKFIQGRFQTLCSDSEVDSKENVELMKKVTQAHKYLAVKDIFAKTNCMEKYSKEFTNVDLTNEDILKPGLVYRQGDGKLKFLHKTVSFYFVAEWFIERYLDSRFMETYDDNENDEFVINDTYNIMNWINLIAHRKRCHMTSEEAADLGNELIKKQRKDKNTLKQIFIELYDRNFLNLFHIILDSFSQPKTAKFIDKHFDDMFYFKDEGEQCLISVFDGKSFAAPMLKGRFVFAMLEWASKNLKIDNQMNLKKMLAERNDRLESPFFWVLSGDYNAQAGRGIGNSFWLLEEISLIGCDTIRRLGEICKEAFANDNDKFYSLLVAEKGETIFFRTPWKFEIFKALSEVVEEVLGTEDLIDLLTRQSEENRVFTNEIDFRGNSDYQQIWILIAGTLDDENIFNTLLIRKQEKVESLEVILRCGNSEIFEMGWRAMQQFSTPEALKEMMLNENTGIRLNLFMSTISNPDLKVFESFLEKMKALSDNDPEIIDKTFMNSKLNSEAEHQPYRVAFMTPLFQAVETHFEIAEFWAILKRHVADIRVVTRAVLELKHPTRNFLHIYIERHHKRNEFEEMLAKFWRTLRQDLDLTTIDSLLSQKDFSTGIVKLSFYESFEYFSDGFKEKILVEDDIKRIHNEEYTAPITMERVTHDIINYPAAESSTTQETVTAQTTQSVPTTTPVLIELQEIQRELAEIRDLPEAINKVKELIVHLKSAKSTDEKARVIANFYGIPIDTKIRSTGHYDEVNGLFSYYAFTGFSLLIVLVVFMYFAFK